MLSFAANDSNTNERPSFDRSSSVISDADYLCDVMTDKNVVRAHVSVLIFYGYIFTRGEVNFVTMVVRCKVIHCINLLMNCGFLCI